MTLFLEPEVILREAFKGAPDGAVYVIGARLRGKALKPRGWRACSLCPQFMRLIKRAGLKPWPRPFHNLPASRETELMHEHPIHVVTAWLGNSPQIAMKHCCMVTEEDFRKARTGAGSAAPRPRQPAAHIPAHEQTDMWRKPRRSSRTPRFAPIRTTRVQTLRWTPLPRRLAKTCETLRKIKTEGTGFEPATDFSASDFESDR